jgi:hypothetical protein
MAKDLPYFKFFVLNGMTRHNTRVLRSSGFYSLIFVLTTGVITVKQLSLKEV